jgi:hypothetical protein
MGPPRRGAGSTPACDLMSYHQQLDVLRAAVAGELRSIYRI